MAKHKFDIIRWDWGTSTNSKKLVDIFTGVCKEYDHKASQIKPFNVIRGGIPLTGANAAANKLLKFTCKDPNTWKVDIEVDTDDSTYPGTIFGLNAWAAD